MQSLLTVSSYLVMFGGIIAVILSGWLGLKFIRVPGRFGRAIAMNCLGEMVAGIATLIFASYSVLTGYGEMPSWLVLSLRIAIFTALTGSTVHLYRTYRKTIDEPD